MNKGNVPKPAISRLRQDGDRKEVNGKKGFIRRRINFRQAAEAAAQGGRPVGSGSKESTEAAARADALDEAQVALESFYDTFPVVPLLSVAHAKVR